MTDKNRSIDELLNILEVRITDFQRALGEQKAERYLIKAKKFGYIHSYKGDKEGKQE